MQRKNTSLPTANSLRPLTPKEMGVLEFIEQHLLSSGFSPSYQEIMDHFGLASFNSVQNYLKQLKAKGYISFPANQKRAIQVLHPARSVQEKISQQVSTRSLHDPLLQAHAETLFIPYLGRVAAGRPIERVIDNEKISVPFDYVKNPKKTFALKVEGDSMIVDGIFDGDTLLIQQQSTAQNGDIVVATVDNEATVKRYYLRPYPYGTVRELMIELKPSNPQLKSMWYSPDEVEIRGKLVGLLRKY